MRRPSMEVPVRYWGVEGVPVEYGAFDALDTGIIPGLWRMDDPHAFREGQFVASVDERLVCAVLSDAGCYGTRWLGEGDADDDWLGEGTGCVAQPIWKAEGFEFPDDWMRTAEFHVVDERTNDVVWLWLLML